MFYFEHEREDGVVVSMSIDSETVDTWPEVTEKYLDFLRACGYIPGAFSSPDGFEVNRD